MNAPKTSHIALRVDNADAANLASLAAAAHANGRTFVSRSSLIRQALAFAVAHIDGFAAISL